MSNEKLKERPTKLVEDDDNPVWTKADFARARPASEVHGAEIAAGFIRKRGRPAKPEAERKQQVTLRLSPDVRDAMRSAGPGWMGRAEAVLRREFTNRAAAREPGTDLIARKGIGKLKRVPLGAKETKKRA